MNEIDVYYCVEADCQKEFYVKKDDDPFQCPYCGDTDIDFEDTRKML
jgi:DNA-directed RNA polymerase subunit RPC12/RpoP